MGRRESEKRDLGRIEGGMIRDQERRERGLGRIKAA